MRVVAILLQIVGWGLVAWSAVVGLSFVAIFLLGFVVSSGGEYGGELAGMLMLTTLGTGVGYAVARLGKSLSKGTGPADLESAAAKHGNETT